MEKSPRKHARGIEPGSSCSGVLPCAQLGKRRARERGLRGAPANSSAGPGGEVSLRMWVQPPSMSPHGKALPPTRRSQQQTCLDKSAPTSSPGGFGMRLLCDLETIITSPTILHFGTDTALPAMHTCTAEKWNNLAAMVGV